MLRKSLGRNLYPPSAIPTQKPIWWSTLGIWGEGQEEELSSCSPALLLIFCPLALTWKDGHCRKESEFQCFVLMSLWMGNETVETFWIHRFKMGHKSNLSVMIPDFMCMTEKKLVWLDQIWIYLGISRDMDVWGSK